MINNLKLPSGKVINIYGMDVSEKEFIKFLEGQNPYKEMVYKERIKALKDDFKVYEKNKPKGKKEEEGN